MQSLAELKSAASVDLGNASFSSRSEAIQIPELVCGLDATHLDPESYRFIASLQHNPYLQDQVVVLAGGATGIGEKIAAISAAAGAYVVILDVAKDIEEKHRDHGRIVGVNCDITNQARVRQVMEELGRFQKLALVAGYFGDRPEAGKLDAANLERHMTINANGIAYVMDAALSGLMNPLNRGFDPAVSTILTKNILNPSHLSYAMSKAAELGMVKFYENEVPKLLDKARKEVEKAGGQGEENIPVLPRSISYWPDNVIDTPLWGRTEEERLAKLRESYAKRGTTYEAWLKNPNPSGEVPTSWKIAINVVADWQPYGRLRHGTAVHLNGGAVPIQLV